MIVYQSNKEKFLKDVEGGCIDELIRDSLKEKLNHKVGKSEYTSWQNSQGNAMYHVMNSASIPNDAGVAIEYNLPRSKKRIDFIITGQDQNKHDQIIIIELKQWTEIEATDKDAIVITRFQRGSEETLHPSYQAWSYSAWLLGFNSTVFNENINLNPCAYLHNHKDTDHVISDSRYKEYLQKAPAFCKGDKEKLQAFIAGFVKFGDKSDIMYRVDKGEIRPTKNLADSLVKMINGNKEFIMIDEQKIVLETALSLTKKSSNTNKNVLIVEGGPGTGKSVVAVNLLVEITRLGLNSQYVTKNAAPRAVFESKLTGTLKKTHISNMFVGSGVYTECDSNTFDTLIVDEAHRLNAKSGMFKNKGENQIKEIINAAKCAVFFIDEDQKVTFSDIGESSEIERWAKLQGANVHKLKLESQFRCNGSDGYLAWLDNVLQIRDTANTTLDDINYDFKIVDSPVDLKHYIFEKNKINNKARIVAGYCWDWISKKNKNAFDISIPEHKFSMRWNLESDGSLWIISPESVNEVGCIHTCQGLELEYIGVIVGNDLVVSNGQVITNPAMRAKTDKSINGYKKLLKTEPEEAYKKVDAIIKNTYRTLMTRGMKGCCVYFTDKETAQYFKQQLSFNFSTTKPESVADLKIEIKSLVSQIRSEIDELKKFTEYLPVYSPAAACGNFGSGEAVEKEGWIKVGKSIKLTKKMFVVRAYGKSMEPQIHEGCYCVFKWPVVGTRNGKIVLVQHNEYFDPDNGGGYSIKKYTSEKHYGTDGNWQHEKILLRPLNIEYQPIEIKESEAESFTVIAEFVAVIAN